MIRHFTTATATLSLAAILLLPARASADEADDLQRMIDSQKRGASDLERLDGHKAAREDITLLRSWLDDAWRYRSEQDYDEARAVLDRCAAQADMIRERIKAADMSAQASEKEGTVKRVRSEIDKTSRKLESAKMQKAALGAQVGK